MKRDSCLFGLTFLVGCALISAASQEGVIATYLGTDLRTIAKDTNGKIYVGGRNEIVQFHPNLTVANRVATGPKRDNRNCPPNPNDKCPEQRTLTNYTSMLLVIDSKRDAVISCSTLYFGFCEKYSLTDLTLQEQFYQQIIPDTELSVIAKITNGFGGTDLLYIASAPTLLPNSNVRGKAPMLASRNVETLEIAHKKTSTASFIDYRIEYLKPGYVTFKEVFEDDIYIYYLTVQMDRVTSSATGNYRSHLMRLCKNDERYYSYIQIPLECDTWPDTFNVAQAAYVAKPGRKLASQEGLSEEENALFVSFSKSFANSELISSDSAICVFSMEEIARTFVSNLRNCFKGSGGLIGPQFLKNRKHCEKNAANVGASYCGEYDANHPIEGSDAAVGRFNRKVGSDIVTSLLVKITGNTTIAYMGTTKGQLLKMRLDPNVQTPVYSRTQLVNSTIGIRRQMLFDNEDKKENIYLMTKTKVLKVKLFNCEQHTTCDACVGDNEPHCGWCFRYNKCMTQNECPKATPYKDYKPWLNYENVCPKILSLSPDPIGYDAIQNISMTVDVSILPQIPTGELFCELEARIIKKTTPAKWIIGKNKVIVTCQRFQNLQALPNNQSNLTANLSIKLGRTTGITWATSTVDVYDCSARSASCHSCTNTEFPCVWCMGDNTCISSNQKCTAVPTSIGGASQQPEYSHVGNDVCPSIELLHNESLIVHSGVNASFKVKAVNFQPLLTDFKCLFKINGLVQTVTASYTGDIVTCNILPLSYPQNVAFAFAELNLVWGTRNLKIDNPNDIKVEVYKCTEMENHCGKCLVLDPSYQCGWCPGAKAVPRVSAFCGLKGDCKTNWKNYTEDCEDVKIMEIDPTAGPVNGGTKLNITGQNMGKTITDITSVVVAGVECKVIDYSPSVSFVCVTKATNRNTSGPVRVSVKNKYNATSKLQYRFVDPVLKDFNPKTGPVAGSTNVTISGRDLDIGNAVKITIGGNPCEVIQRNSTSILFSTPKQMHPIEAKVVLEIDESEDIVLSKPFGYTEDPEIKRIRPISAISSGGNLLDIDGVNLNSIQKPKMFAIFGDQKIFSDCISPKLQKGFMQCPTPRLSQVLSPGKNGVKVHYGFVMDGVQDLLNISQTKFSPMTYYPDPKLHKFKSVKNYKSNEKLIIEGENLMYLREFSGKTVTVGNLACTREQVLSQTQIQCDPPTADQMRRNTDKNGNAEVIFSLGNYKASVGHLKYSGAGLAIGAVIGIIVGVLVLIGLIVVVVIVMKRRKRKAKKDLPSVIYNPKKDANAYTDNNADGPGPTDQLLPVPATPVDPDKKQDEESYITLVLSRLENQKLVRHVQEVLISRKRLELGETLGKGHFGQVFLATLTDSNMENGKKVAVKTLQGTDLDQKQIENFLREGVIMKNFHHIHIMSLLGVCIGPNQEPMVILPFMANGDLRNYVKDKKKNFTARQLLHLAQQVAEGMAYLASLNFVHRDLAARNCMIDDCEIVKVADFGLTREIYEREYYSLKDRKAKLPIKWMALESLEDFVFTMKSDVWSFGVLMWELMTRGVTPYPDVDAFDLRNYLASARRLRKPKYCPDNVYKIMMDCWDEIPERRPTFADLVNRLELLLNPPKKRTRSQEESDYQNVDQLKKDDYLNPVTGEP